MEIAKKTNFNISLLQIGAKLYHKLGNVLLPIGASVITNWGSLIITNQGKFYYKSGQLLQIRATVITNWGITLSTHHVRNHLTCRNKLRERL